MLKLLKAKDTWEGGVIEYQDVKVGLSLRETWSFEGLQSVMWQRGQIVFISCSDAGHTSGRGYTPPLSHIHSVIDLRWWKKG